MPHALHKYAEGHGYPEKSSVLDVRGSGGFDQYIYQSQKFGHMGWFYSCHRYRQHCCGALPILSCGVALLACTFFFGKTHCRLISTILDFFDCSDRRRICRVDGPNFGTL